MITYYNKLTEDIEITIGNKKDGLLILIFDSKRNVFISTDKKEDTIKILAEILNKQVVEIKRNPDIASHLIPINIIFKEYQITKMGIGFSALEMNYNIKHSIKDFEKARDSTLKFIKSGGYDTKNVNILFEERSIKEAA